MQAQRICEGVEADHRAEIERLYVRLAVVNAGIAELEKMHSQSDDLESLKTSALSLTRQIDEARCSIADEQLTGLLAR
ncbi:MAG: hypothetical protein K2X57_20330 [Xanthobacteraceae bacterium]|jgi:hypothetical protein|nr:hypothetical protein [Xanthobacteraceae bacterium]